jgi:hypothetical protein
MSLFVSFATFCIMTLYRSTLALPHTSTIPRPISILPAPPALKIPTKKPTKNYDKANSSQLSDKETNHCSKIANKKPFPTAPVVFMTFVFKDWLNLVTYRLNSLSGDSVSQVFYLFCKELRFEDVHSLKSG